eukprot:tig00000215_g18644.t1
MADRGLKRAREDDVSPVESSFSTTGSSSAAAAKADGSADGVNHFARLPDELVQRIFSELEATEAYETCQLWSMDRRFRQIMRGVHWKELRLQLLEADTFLDYTQRHTKQLARATTRVKSGSLAGCRRLVVGAASAFLDSTREDSQEEVEGKIESVNAMTDALAALSAAPVPLEDVCLSGDWRGWTVPREEDVTVELPPLDDVARSFLAALRPAPLRSLQLDDRGLFSAFVASAAPGCFPLLRELRVERAFPISAQIVSRLAEVWPSATKISCCVSNGVALRQLSRLPLEELRVAVDANEGLEGALGAIDADCVRSLRLGRTNMAGPGVLASIPRLRNLEELWISVDHSSGEALAGLGALPKLRSLHLYLQVAQARDHGAGLMQAAAAWLAAAPSLQSLDLLVDGQRWFEEPAARVHVASLVALLRAGRSALQNLSVHGLPLSADVSREVARASQNSKLSAVSLFHAGLKKKEGVEALRAFDELFRMPEGYRADLRVEVYVTVPHSLFERAMGHVSAQLGRRPNLPLYFRINDVKVRR